MLKTRTKVSLIVTSLVFLVCIVVLYEAIPHRLFLEGAIGTVAFIAACCLPVFFWIRDRTHAFQSAFIELGKTHDLYPCIRSGANTPEALSIESDQIICWKLQRDALVDYIKYPKQGLVIEKVSVYRGNGRSIWYDGVQLGYGDSRKKDTRRFMILPKNISIGTPIPIQGHDLDTFIATLRARLGSSGPSLPV